MAIGLRRWLMVLGVSAMCLLQAACAGYSPSGLSPGSSRDETIKTMGLPTGEYRLANGGTRLEFARGPFGKHTYMLDFDASGRLGQWQQVLTEANFSAMQMGMDQQQVLMTLGRPSEKRYIGWQKLVLWSYRYDATFCQWFNVGIDVNGKVADLGYTPDPLCDIDDNFDIRVP